MSDRQVKRVSTLDRDVEEVSTLERDWGRFTAKGGEEVENLIRGMIREISDTVQQNTDNDKTLALIMLGGYGRGEGGVISENGKELPHNNFDLLYKLVCNNCIILLTKNTSLSEQGKIKSELMIHLDRLSERFAIGIDLSVINEAKLSSSACRIIWYDMRFGHKVLFGDRTFVVSQQHFNLDTIPDWDARNLMVNRGTLMIINDLLMEKPNLTPEYNRLIVKHIVKAIIGYGDTLLYFMGDYHWSYLEKQKLMRARKDVDIKFRDIYEEAMNFRFEPDYEAYLNRDLNEWIENLREHFQKIFLFCETQRQKRMDLEWKDYLSSSYSFALTDELSHLKPFAKKLINFAKRSKNPGLTSIPAKLGYKTLDDAGRLPVFFPLIAFNLEESGFISIAQNYLHSDTSSWPALRRAYLKKWGEFGDNNFINVLKKYGISLDRK